MTRNFIGRVLVRTVQKSPPSPSGQFSLVRTGLEHHRYFSGLNGQNGVVDVRKFTHEVKVIMPDVGEGADVKGGWVCHHSLIVLFSTDNLTQDVLN